MARLVVLLRGVNVGGRSSLPMAKLAAALREAGYEDTKTLLASGNVILTSATKGAKLESKLERTIAEALAFETECFVRTAAEWSAIVDANPFAVEAKESASKLVFLALRSAPTERDIAAFEARRKKRDTPERVTIDGRGAYVHYPDGIGRSKLDLSPLGLGTARNWNTVLRILGALA